MLQNKQIKSLILVFLGLSVWLLLPLTGLFAAYGEDFSEMPVWFWEPSANRTTSVGFSRVYTVDSSGYQQAFEDGAWRLWVDRKSRVRTERTALTDASGTFLFDAPYRVDVDSSGFERFRRVVVRLDSVKTKTMVAMLVGLREGEVENNAVAAPEPPASLDVLQKVGVYRAVGMAPRYYHEKSSWAEAETEARRELALLVRNRVAYEEMRLGDLEVGTQVTSADVTLFDVRTVKRAVNPKSELCWVMVEVSRNGVAATESPEGLLRAHEQLMEALVAEDEAIRDSLTKAYYATLDSLEKQN